MLSLLHCPSFSVRLSLLFLYSALYLTVIAELLSLYLVRLWLCCVLLWLYFAVMRWSSHNEICGIQVGMILWLFFSFFFFRCFFQQVEYRLFIASMIIFRFSSFQGVFIRYSCVHGRKMGKVICRDNSWVPDIHPLKLICH